MPRYAECEMIREQQKILVLWDKKNISYHKYYPAETTRKMSFPRRRKSARCIWRMWGGGQKLHIYASHKWITSDYSGSEKWKIVLGVWTHTNSLTTQLKHAHVLCGVYICVFTLLVWSFPLVSHSKCKQITVAVFNADDDDESVIWLFSDAHVRRIYSSPISSLGHDRG